MPYWLLFFASELHIATFGASQDFLFNFM